MFRRLCLHSLQNAMSRTVTSAAQTTRHRACPCHRGSVSSGCGDNTSMAVMDCAVPSRRSSPKPQHRSGGAVTLPSRDKSRRGLIRDGYKHTEGGCVDTVCGNQHGKGSTTQLVRFKDLLFFTLLISWLHLIVCQ